MFCDNGLVYQEDLMWMGPRAFAFYLQAMTNYLRRDDAAGDDHMIDCMCMIVNFRLPQEGFSLALHHVHELLDYVLEHYEKFEVTEEVYGDVKGKYRQLRERLAARR
ncbi:MAG: hypothetical protein JRI68_32720 [Deltaproteobacteria bacterium]|nr:hypothetical protein [Deltaproteobacteria bacterium]